jgi:hypothetical protein
MDVRLLRRPLVELVFGRSQCLFAGNVAARRHESSFRRTKKLLNIKPDDTFLFTKSSPKQDHMIFNPPSSTPSVLQTPLKFLPKDDKRRKLFEDAATSTLAAPSQLGPPVRPLRPTYQRHHLTEDDITQMRKMRAEDPDKWSVGRLARKYNTTNRFILICTQNKEKHEAHHAKVEANIARMGPRRRKAREDRLKRWEQIYKDE